jgi:hypothetical protein
LPRDGRDDVRRIATGGIRIGIGDTFTQRTDIDMNKFGKLLGVASLALAFGTATVMAQAPATAPAKKTFKLKTPTTAAGKACSDQADAKGLHGKERKTFRSTCKKGIKKS